VAAIGFLPVLLLGRGEEEPVVVVLDLEGGAQSRVRGGPHVPFETGFDLAEVAVGDAGRSRALAEGEADFHAALTDFRPVHPECGGLGFLHALKVADETVGN
jgi:hypothetical protein